MYSRAFIQPPVSGKRVRRPSSKAKELQGDGGSEDDVNAFAVLSFRGGVDDSSDESVRAAAGVDENDVDNDDDNDDADDDDDDDDEDEDDDDEDDVNEVDDDDDDDIGDDESEDDEDGGAGARKKRRTAKPTAAVTAAAAASGARATTLKTVTKRVPPRNYGDTPLVLGEDDGDAARWRARRCVHCQVEMLQLCFNNACAACCGAPSGRQCVAHGRFALMTRSDPLIEAEAAGGDMSQANTLSFFSSELQLFVCPCGSEWPTQKSFAGHCGQCEAWKARHTTPAAFARRRHQQPTPFVGDTGAAELARVFPRSDSADAAWAQLRRDTDAFPPLSTLVTRHTAHSLALALSANQLRLYIERCGVRAGPTLAERQRQLEVLADAPHSIGLAVSAMAQPRWLCLCGRQFEFEMALARHAVCCSEWEPLPSVCGIALADVELRDIAAVCGARQVARDHKPCEALREASEAALMLQRGMQAAAIEARIACLQMTYGVPVRTALTHIATMLASSEPLPPPVKRVLNDAKAALMPLFETISSPVSRSKSTLDELEQCDIKLRHWLAALCQDPIISGMMAEASRRHTLQ